MTNLIQAGLLPLFAGLYDQHDPADKDSYQPYIRDITRRFFELGIDLLTAPVCLYEAQTRQAVRRFEEQGVSAIVVLFLAYHPSLESAAVLAGTSLPLIMLDTTECYDFGPQADPAMIMRCHGIHGLQDLCCVLQRLGKSYQVEAGHCERSDVLARTARDIQAARIAGSFRRSRVGLIGDPFTNMGDFALPFDQLEKLTGIQVVRLDQATAGELCLSIGPEQLGEQTANLLQHYLPGDDLASEILPNATRTTLAIAEWIKQARLNAFSFNFLDFNRDLGLPAVPFVTACEMMAQGIGYAGEGDVLTAALTAALLTVYPDSTFTEMFCPDWQGGTVFMSHMGEVNRRIIRQGRLVQKTVPYLPGHNQGVVAGITGFYQGGRAILVNLAPGRDDTFRLILAPCEIIEPADSDRFQMSVRGWLQPQLPLADFLQQYSRLGGTHHSCLCYGADIGVLKVFGDIMGWPVAIL